MRRLIIFCEHAVETLTYFSKQLAQAFAGWGYETFWMDFDRLGLSAWKLRQALCPHGQCQGMQAVLVTFNFIGLSGEEQLWDMDGQGLPVDSIWEKLGVLCLNIMVDHPAYYYKALRHPVPGMQAFCIDRTHAAYMERFYPHIRCMFLPLAGNRLLQKEADMEPLERWLNRPYALVFTANYVPLENIEKQLGRLGPQYQAFYYEVIGSFLKNPGQELLEGAEYYLRREMPDISNEDVCATMHTMIAVDLWIRTYFREKTVLALVENGVQVHVFGKGWEMVSCGHPQNLILSGRMVSSQDCVQAAAGAKIALNTMPWFKDGGHDRIFTAMLQGAAALTDPSKYLLEQFTDQGELFYYDLGRLEQLPELVKKLLQEPGKLYGAASRGKIAAQKGHTWQCRAVALRSTIEGRP